MNQRCSELLFSKKTELGRKNIGDHPGAKCCKVLREGIIEGLDSSGIDSGERCRLIFELKTFLDENISIKPTWAWEDNHRTAPDATL